MLVIWLLLIIIIIFMISTGQGCCVSEAGQAGGAQPQAGGGGGEAGVQVRRGTCSEYGETMVKRHNCLQAYIFNRLKVIIWG